MQPLMQQVGCLRLSNWQPLGDLTFVHMKERSKISRINSATFNMGGVFLQTADGKPADHRQPPFALYFLCFGCASVIFSLFLAF